MPPAEEAHRGDPDDAEGIRRGGRSGQPTALHRLSVVGRGESGEHRAASKAHQGVREAVDEGVVVYVATPDHCGRPGDGKRPCREAGRGQFGSTRDVCTILRSRLFYLESRGAREVLEDVPGAPPIAS